MVASRPDSKEGESVVKDLFLRRETGTSKLDGDRGLDSFFKRSLSISTELSRSLAEGGTS